MKYTPEELEKTIFEVETARGISKADHPSLQALPPKRYLFVLLWCDSEVIIRNKTQWAQCGGVPHSSALLNRILGYRTWEPHSFYPVCDTPLSTE